MFRAAYCNIYTCIYIYNQLDAQIPVIRFYLSLRALHVSDSLVHHQEQHLELYIAIGISRYVYIYIYRKSSEVMLYNLHEISR